MSRTERDTVVLVSGFGNDGRGGVFAMKDDTVEILDSVATVGLAFSDPQGTDGGLGRLLRAPGELTSTAELLVYDERGIVEYRRLDAVRDPHDLLALDRGWLVVSTGSNELVHVEADGSTHVVWHGGGEPDAWHVNCATVDGADVWASAFGEFATFKEWRGPAAVNSGRLWNLRTGESVEGLTHPHSPRRIDGRWLVCESLDGVLTRVEARGAPAERVQLGGYTRGLAVAGDELLVGVSAPRDDEHASANVTVVDRDTLAVRGRVEFPCREIYDIVVVPAAFATAIRAGFATNAYRIGAIPAGQWTAGTAADPGADACRCRVALPPERAEGERWTADVEVENTGTSWLGSVEPRPVFAASRWLDERNGRQVDGDRMPLPVVLAPGQRTIVQLPISAPAAGTYRLRVSLVREGEYWLDDIAAEHGEVARVAVRKPAPNG